jgi:hypothetical protein
MQACFSEEDDRDEKATRLYTVIGKLDGFVPEIKTRISNGGTFLDIDPAEVFEHFSAPFPEEWKNKVLFRSEHSRKKCSVFSWLLLVRHKIIHRVKYNAVCA